MKLDKTVSQVIAEAADILERNGLHQGWFYDERQYNRSGTPPENCSMCLLGAVNTAIFGAPAIEFLQVEGIDESVISFRDSVIERIAESIRDREYSLVGGATLVIDFSDGEDMTTERMVAHLRSIKTD